MIGFEARAALWLAWSLGRRVGLGIYIYDLSSDCGSVGPSLRLYKLFLLSAHDIFD